MNEECFPYQGVENVKCKIPLRKRTLVASGCVPPRSPAKRIHRYHVSPPHLLGNETDIIYDIMNSGPVQGSFMYFNFHIRSFMFFLIQNH